MSFYRNPSKFILFSPSKLVLLSKLFYKLYCKRSMPFSNTCRLKPKRNHGKPILNFHFMEKFNRLSRVEMKNVLGGLRRPADPDPKDDTECMLKSIGDVCDVGSQCTRILYPAPNKGSYLRCSSTNPDIPRGL